MELTPAAMGGCLLIMSAVLPPAFLPIVAGMFGLMVGSFLNVCIYRLPRDLSVNRPARSFCPLCSSQIPWFHNVPVLSWLLLGGKCSRCRGSIPSRYLFVELLTGLLFAGIAWRFGWLHFGAMLANLVLVSLLLVGSFVDAEFFILPDQVTLGGLVSGICLSALWPEIHGTTGVVPGVSHSLLGAAIGYGILWFVAEAGRLVFGRRKIVFEKPVSIEWRREGDVGRLSTEGEETCWTEFFPRGSEVLTMRVREGHIDGSAEKAGDWCWAFEELRIDGKTFDLNVIERIVLEVVEMQIPREVMGYGDVKLLACIGAFLGWKAVLFTFMAGCMIGALVGSTSLLVGRREWASKIPFGPYLAIGAMMWLFVGPELLSAYWGVLQRNPR